MSRIGTWSRRVALVAVLTGVWTLSSQPSLKVLPPLFPLQDKVYHLFEFGILAAVLWWNRDLAGGRVMLLMAVAALWGGADEIHQSFVPGRDCSVYDFSADCAGAGVVLAWLAVSRRRRFHAPAPLAGEGDSRL